MRKGKQVISARIITERDLQDVPGAMDLWEVAEEDAEKIIINK